MPGSRLRGSAKRSWQRRHARPRSRQTRRRRSARRRQRSLRQQTLQQTSGSPQGQRPTRSAAGSSARGRPRTKHGPSGKQTEGQQRGLPLRHPLTHAATRAEFRSSSVIAGGSRTGNAHAARPIGAIAPDASTAISRIPPLSRTSLTYAMRRGSCTPRRRQATHGAPKQQAQRPSLGEARGLQLIGGRPLETAAPAEDARTEAAQRSHHLGWEHQPRSPRRVAMQAGPCRHRQEAQGRRA